MATLTFPTGYFSYLGRLSQTTWAPFVFVFVAYLLAAKLGHFLFTAYDISPAVIWPSVGIAVAAVFLGGYRMLIPVALAQLVATLTYPPLIPLVAAAVVIGCTFQAAVGAFLLKRFNFRAEMDRGQDAILIILVALFVPVIAPALSTTARILTDTLTVDPLFNWSRAWAGGILSIMILTPLITSWAHLPRSFPIGTLRHRLEVLLSFATLLGATYIVFWTQLPQVNLFVVLYVFFAVLFWIALRMSPRVMTFSLFSVTVFGMLGSIIAQPLNPSISNQLFADELFMELVAPIFFILCAVVSERQRALALLSQRAEGLEASVRSLAQEDKSKNEFIAVLAHELRNPLAPMLNTLEILRLREQSPQYLKLLQGAERQAYTMRRLLDDLLDLTRVSQQKFELREEPTDLHTLMENAVANVEGLMQSLRHRFIMTERLSNVRVTVDPVRFEQIISNLLNNAAKYTPPGGTISLRYALTNNELEVSVEDTGIGINPSELEAIFLPFRQIPQSGTARGTGLGIGLALTRKLVEMHGGTIEAKSAGHGKGSTFTARFPMEPAPGGESTPILRRAKAFSSAPRSSPLSILVVDDNETAANTLAQLLSLRGHTVKTAHSGAEAIKEVEEGLAPDVIFLDIGLPDLDGYEVAKRMRARRIASTIIALTGYGQPEDKLKSRAAGCDHHLVKPVGLADIENVFTQLASV